MLRRLILIVVLLVLGVITPKPSLAVGEFGTSYQVNYRVETSGLTHATFNISLKNKLSNVYAKEFALSIGSTNLSNVKAYNASGGLNFTLNQGQKTTNVAIPFDDKVLGKDQAQEFSLEFDTSDFAHRSGRVWDVSIPKLSDSDALESYQLTLTIPSQFGEPSVISPKPVTSAVSVGYTTFQFTAADLLESGVAATFGHQQWFDFDLTYHLENSQVYPVRTEIALPPDTAFQQVAYQTLEPTPENISIDADGNWLASYLLSPRKNLQVIATGSAQIDLKPRPEYPQNTPDLSQYLKAQHYWETDNPEIKKLAQTLTTPKQIYQYVVNNLIYDYGRLSGNSSTRYGAANALGTPDSAICMEFTDLFIALARAAGIPARAVNGYAYTNNPALRPLSLEKDVLHAWPEYYDSDKNLWVPVDPTWGNTTGGVDYFSQFDLNHFTFVKQGLNSEYPIPAGAYKLIGSESKDVLIDFGQSVLPKENFAILFKLPTSAIAGVPIKGEVVVKNTGTVALYDLPLTVSSNHFSLKNAAFTIPQLPPFATFAVPIELPATAWTDNLTDTVVASSGDTTASHQITLTPAYNLLLTPKNIAWWLAGLGLLLTLLAVLKYRHKL